MSELFKSLAIVTEDNFVFMDVTEVAVKLFNSGIFDLYVLHNDNSESLIERAADLNDALEVGLRIVIEVGAI
jgi:hypothetical protein